MEKFKIESKDMDLEDLLDCIINKSTFAVRAKPKDYYTFNNRPTDWEQQFIGDIRKSIRVDYRGRVFYVLFSGENVLNVYNQSSVYYFDSFYSDDPILNQILETRNKRKQSKITENK